MPPGPETQRRKFGGTSCPGFVDDRRENAGPAAFWPSTGRGRVRTVASTCQDRRFDGGGGLGLVGAEDGELGAGVGDREPAVLAGAELAPVDEHALELLVG